jgi:hypothetical protein
LTKAILAQQAATLDGGDLINILAELGECSDPEAELHITERSN